jgi:hypothetical protein
MNSHSLGAFPAGWHELAGPGWATAEPMGGQVLSNALGAGAAGQANPSGTVEMPNAPSGVEAAQPVHSVEHANRSELALDRPGDRLAPGGNVAAARAAASGRMLSVAALRSLNLPPMAASLAAQDARFGGALHHQPAVEKSADRLMKSIEAFANSTESEFTVLAVNLPELKTKGNFIQNQAKFYGQMLEVQRVMMKFQMHLSCAEAVQSVPKKVTDTITNMQS